MAVIGIEIKKCNKNGNSLGPNKKNKAIISSDGNACSFLYEGFIDKNEFRN